MTDTEPRSQIAMAGTRARDARVGVSTITFRFRPLEEALRLIAALGAVEVDLGAIPAVTDHVPVPFDGDPARYVAALDRHGLRSGAVNSDVGDLNDPGLSARDLEAVARPLVDLAAATGGALIVPCGRASWEPYVDEASDLARIAGNLELLAQWCGEAEVRLLGEVLHHRRWIHTTARADALLAMVGPEQLGVVLDVSHVVASQEDPARWAAALGDRVERVHLRDAIAGNLNLGIGRGEVDFEAVVTTLEAQGFGGTYILELETHDVAEEDREADARRSLGLIRGLVAGTRR